MIIRSANVVRCPPRWLLIKIESEDGEVGWGEAIGDLHDEVEAALQSICKRITGREITGIERIKQEMHKGRFWRDGPVLNTAISSLEMALWDLNGKIAGMPTYELLGGPVRDIGGAKLAIDLHGRLTPSASRRLLPMLEPFDISFVEEPCLPDGSAHHLRDLQQLHLEQRIPLATGERLLTKRQFADHLFPSPVAAVIQPDLSLVGGIRTGIEIGAMCEAAQVSFAPHCPYGPIQFAASLQVAAASPAHAFQEFQSLGGAAGGGTPGGGANWDFNLLATPFEIDDGMVELPKGNGLGIEVQEHLIEEHLNSWNPHPPTIWQNPDGSHAEW